jgi:hypothetical protein
MTDIVDIDKLIWMWKVSIDREERRKIFNKILQYLDKNWIYLVAWSGFDAWGIYYVAPDMKRCVYIAENERTEPITRVIKEVEFKDPNDLANYIWSEHKGIIPFKRIAKRIRDVFGVDVTISQKNQWIRIMFGEASGEI